MAYMKFIGKQDTTKYKDIESFRDLITYITNPAKAISIGFINVSSLQTAAAEMQAVASQGRKASGKKICHIVITFTADELRKHSPAMIDDVARQCLMYFGKHYQAIYAMHEYPHLHIHLVFNRVSHVDFKRFPDRYEDRAGFWSFLHGILRNYNIRLWKT